MEQRIRDRYNDSILQEAMRCYGIAEAQIQSLDSFESFIFEFRQGSDAYILRLGHSLRRSPDLVHGEVDWINFLAANGVPVARAVPSQRGELVEAMDDGQGGTFLATAFVKAPGRPPWEVGWTPERYTAYGQALGKMHAAARVYQPAIPAWKRPEWDDDLMEVVDHFLPVSETAARQQYRALIDHTRTLPKDSASYGLIHQDAHQSNFFMTDDGTITLFDFDDCAYSWFINDIAIVLFYFSASEESDGLDLMQQFMPPFLQGYRQFNMLDPKWLKEIPTFLKIREIDLYAVIQRDFDLDNITNEWCAHFMRERKERIERNVPFLDFDFETLAMYL
jgi:Ser/Thr protein kinase RdoA (MazF antagonist)